MIRDAAARATALDPTRSFIVQAPAGSGKTGLLVYRVLRLLATVEQPQQILAITFTRKATAEMRERLFSLMQMAEAGASSADSFEQLGLDLASQALQRDAQMGWDLLSSPHQLQILTIDAFCAKLTSSMPWLSRLGDRPRTTDQADSHYAAAVEQLLSELLDPNSAISPALQTVMLELDYNYPKARKLFSAMLAKRDQWLRYLLRHDLPELRASLERAWADIVATEVDNLRQIVPNSSLEEWLRLAQHAAQVLLNRPEYKATSLSVFEDFTGGVDDLDPAHWRGLAFMLVAPSSNDFRKTVNVRTGFEAKTKEKDSLLALLTEYADDQDLLQALQQVSALPPLRYEEQDWQQLLALEQVLKSLAAHLQLRFRAVGECDHSEVTQRANLALQEMQNPTDLALRMDYALQHILVDEFQDTSTGQIELLKKLTAGWDSDPDTVKTLFLVGDPMQSIYRFREADVSLFLQVAENDTTRVFDNLRIESLKLSENFRSSSQLVDWFNQTFEDSFPAQDKVLTGAIRYSAATFSRPPNEAEVEYLLAQDKSQEAAMLCAAVQAALEQLPSEEDKIAILVRSRSQLDYMLPSLRDAGIEYVGVDIQPLREQQAVIDLVTLCQALCREDDRLAWLALLRGPWCGLTLSEIKQVAGSVERTVWQQLLGFDNSVIEHNSAQRLQRFVTLMSAAMRQRQQVELAALARWTWQSLGGQHTLFGTSLDDIETVFGLVNKLQRAGDLSSMADLDSALDGLFAQPSQSAARDARVLVSTMHKAKGLQYHTVILPGLGQQARAEEKSIMMWAEQQSADGDAELLLAPLSLDVVENGHYSFLRRLDAQRSRNELIRLMYVATTRAERKLVLLANAKQDEDTGHAKPPIASSLLATVWGALEDQFHFDDSLPVAPDKSLGLNTSLSRLADDYTPPTGAEIDWRVSPLLTSTDESDQPTDPDFDEADEADGQGAIEFEWATQLAKGVGIVLHDWLQHVGPEVLNVALDAQLERRWRAELKALRVPDNKLAAAVRRLKQAASNIQNDSQAHFIFQPYAIQQNEYPLACYQDGSVQTFRIDRTFVDQQGIRWVVDYKSTFTKQLQLDDFVDQQVQLRHRKQLQKYGKLISQIDERPIKLAVYFPLLNQLRSWEYQGE